MKKLTIGNLKGIDRRPNAPPYQARDIRGMRWDPPKARWVSDRGYRAWWPTAPARAAEGSVYSMHVHQTLGGATTDIYMERDTGTGGTGIYRILPYSSAGVKAVQTGRHLPSPREAGTCFASFARVCVAVNGWDQPVRIYPMLDDAIRVEAFGFSKAPPPCKASPLTSDAMRASTTAYYYSLSNGLGDITTAYPTSNSVGLGSTTGNDTNAYRYRYTWVTDTGSESPVSQDSPVVQWDTNADGYRYGVVVTNIQPGPAGTVKRRLYRTRNLGETEFISDATYYFVAEIQNNHETAFCDHIPDGLLGSAAPVPGIESAPLPPQIRWIAEYAGRAWIVSQDYRIFWSQPGQIESFGAASYVDVSSRNGGRITGLIPHDDLLIILRERSIEAVIQSANNTFRAVPLTESVGSRAPHAAISVPGYGLLFVGDDNIYCLQGNLSGGGVIRIHTLTTQIDWSDTNVQALARAWAWWNPYDSEVVFAIPTGAYTWPQRHYCLALDAGSPESPVWSIREGVQSGCGVTGPEGWPLMGDHGVSNTQGNLSLGVWAAYDQYGYDEAYDPNPRPESWWESVDLDLGNPDASKRLEYVTATVRSLGDNPIYLGVYVDSDWEAQGITQESVTHRLDRRELTVLGTAVIDSDDYSSELVSEVRFDLHQLSARRFRLRFRSENVWGLYGYSVYFQEDGPALPISPVVRSTTFSGAPTVNVPTSKLPTGTPR